MPVHIALCFDVGDANARMQTGVRSKGLRIGIAASAVLFEWKTSAQGRRLKILHFWKKYGDEAPQMLSTHMSVFYERLRGHGF
jgi:hypothetical protein